ncbi:SRPBCC family protein [Acinetobacter larvae]|uniref:MxaD family protein n=1 Tax=Acinetobacter larvae TaxID=1789224 RepID=A0A1B2LYE9_9GAMM|nr:SRPBCC family protein [Acinetobacter larvae]AOA57970.1 MxaD family protein [Acinetobacter larvae]
MQRITVKKTFAAPIGQVFALCSQHANYNIAFAPVQVVRTRIGEDPQQPDGVGSIRRLGYGFLKPLQEQITVFEQDQLIQYRIIKNPLIQHHLGSIAFVAIDDTQTEVTYQIELQMTLPFGTKLVLAQLCRAIKLGLSRLAKSV